EDSVGPLRQPAAGQLDERGCQIEPVRLDPVGCPPDEAFEQVPACAADVEERAAAVERVRDRAPRRLPARLVAAEAGLCAWGAAGQVGGLEDRAHLCKPARVVDLPAR